VGFGLCHDSNGHCCLHDLCCIGLMKCSYELYSVAIFLNHFLNQNTLHQQWCWKMWRFERFTALLKIVWVLFFFSFCNWPIPSSCPNLCCLCIRTSDYWNNKSLSLFFSCLCWQVCLVKWTELVCTPLGGVQILLLLSFLYFIWVKILTVLGIGAWKLQLSLFQNKDFNCLNCD
jgi:hypothetical protein